MLIFGADIPLVEMIAGFSIITLIILAEVTIVMLLLWLNIKKIKKISATLVKLSGILIKLEKEKIKGRKK